MITREMIAKELKNNNYNVEPMDVVKNGISFQGITIGNGNIRPTIYINEFLDWSEDKLPEAVEQIIKTYNNAKHTSFNTEQIKDWNYVKNRLQLCLQKKGEENIIKRDFLDLEQYIRVVVETHGNETGSFKVKPEHLEMWEVDKDMLFNAAWDCTSPTITERDMMHIMAEMMGVPVEELAMENMPVQIVLGNKSGIHGAIAMHDTWRLQEIANRYESDLAILPSSIHEIIVMPVNEDISFAELDAMVTEINETQLEPVEVLSNHAYRFHRNTEIITW